MRSALTPEEWAEVGENACIACYTHDKSIPLDTFLDPEDLSRHGLAALCLHEQDFGFTREDVRLLKEQIVRSDPEPPRNHALRDLWGRIEALLPPKEK